MVKFELFNNVGAEGGITVDGVRSFLNANKNEEIQFDISTLGGDLGDAITIHDLIRSHSKKTIANIVGLTASAGTIIAIACDEVQMSDNALFLIHNGWMEVTGNVFDLDLASRQLMKTDAIMVKMYRERTSLPELKIKELMKASDWLSPEEAKQLGFVDRIVSTGTKIAASAIITGAKGKVNELLLTKLEQKMNIFGKKNPGKAEVLNVLALKDGKRLLINAEEVATGIEVAPLGAATLEDGEYELADGRKIMVAGGVITEVVESAPAGEPAEAVIATVAAMLVKSEEKIMATIEAKLKPLEVLASTHKPVKSNGPVSQSQASVEDQLQAKIEAKQAEIRAEAEKKRKGGN